MKRIISLLLILALSFGIVPQSFAARDTENQARLAENLKELGIFRGVSATEFDLNRKPTRVEALVMLIRLLGQENQALEQGGEHPFTDVPQWADSYVGYAYENGITKGVSQSEFGVGDANIQMFLTFVLRALGYTDGGVDFSYSEPYSLSYHAGILPNSVDRENFLRADCVTISYASLSAYLKNQTKTLAEKLIEENVFSKEDFLNYYDKTALNYDSDGKKELTAEEIYQKCSPAVFYIEVYDQRGKLYGSGSGFFIDADGTAVTNYHVIEDMYSAKAILSDSQEAYDVEGVYDYSKENDWAIIKIKGDGFKFLEIGDKETVVGGATVYAIGSPMGLQNTISQGLISNVNRQLDGVTYIQTSAAISQGSSGGAFINKYGEVIGITSAGFLEGENLGLAIPVYAIEGYKKDEITTLEVLSGGGYVQGAVDKETGTITYSAQELLHAFVKKYANSTTEDGIAYTARQFDIYGYFDNAIVLDKDGSLRVLVKQKVIGYTIMTNLYLTGEHAGEVLYNYSDLFGGSIFTGEAKLDFKSFTRDSSITLTKISGQKKNDDEMATDYVIQGLDFINGIFASIRGAEAYSVADLGFVNFK